MKSIVTCALLAGILLVAGCAQNETVTGTTAGTPAPGAASPDAIAQAIMLQTSWPVVAEAEASPGTQPLTPIPLNLPRVEFVGRYPVAGDVVHYEFRIQVGDGPFEVVGLHRVVREQLPDVPIRTPSNIFLLHGDYKNFTGCFLAGVTSPHIPDNFSFAVYLAQRDIDVWGIDQAWALVPDDVTDFSFMADWGLERHVAWAKTSIEVARLLRRMTGNGYQPMILSGYSGGAPIGFALINEEAVLPPGHRKVSAFAPVDWGMRTDLPDWEQAMCDFSAFYQGLTDAGQYQDYIPLRPFGLPAQQDPDGPSDLVPGLSNLQAAFALGTTPFIPSCPAHFLAGTFDEIGVPTGLRYADAGFRIDFLVCAPLYEAAAYERDEYLWTCTTSVDVPWDDHFSRVQVPILWVEAGGGFGPYAHQTLDLLGSTDVTVFTVSLLPPEEILLDFAHLDLFLAPQAPDLVWAPFAGWIQDHSGQGHGH